MPNQLSDDDRHTLRDLLERITAAAPAGSIRVVVRSDADDRFSLSPEDERGAMGLDTPLPDCRGD